MSDEAQANETEQAEDATEQATGQETQLTEQPTESQTEAKAEETKSEQPEQPSDWRDGVPDDLKEFANRFSSPADVVKTAYEFRQKLSKGLQPPGDDAPDEEKEQFRKALGIPDSPEGYEFELPEGREATEQDQAFQQAMAQAMHESGVPAEAAKALNAKWNEMVAATEAEQQRKAEKAREESQAALRKEWGSDYDANLNLAKRAMRAFASDDLVQLMESKQVDGTVLGDHPEIVRAFGNIGRRMGEGDFIGAVTDDERQTKQERIDQIMRENPPGTENYKRPEVQRELRELHEQIYGADPAVGQAGRTA